MKRQLARAKVNLALHVTGRRDDGLHLLDSIVCFADVGDYLSVSEGVGLTLDLTGPQAAHVPLGDDNLVLAAARALGPFGGARILLEKHLPVAAGIGGGSSDAALALVLLTRLWGCEMPSCDAITKLGADVPVCLTSRAARVRGIGEQVEEIDRMPSLHGVLVNPAKPLPTADVFRTASVCVGGGLQDVPAHAFAPEWIDFLCRQRNDLEGPAITLVPEIHDCLEALRARKGCRLARMSGSGATSFGLFDTRVMAAQAAENLKLLHPDWWVVPTLFS